MSAFGRKITRIHRGCFAAVLLGILLAMLVAAPSAHATMSARTCEVQRPKPTLKQVMRAKAPRSGIVGRVVGVYKVTDPNVRGTEIVRIEVERFYGRKPTPFIYVVNPGCCGCANIETEQGATVMTIVKKSNDDRLYPDY